jgi:hypothetical protein
MADERLFIRITPEAKAELKKKADKEGMTISDFIFKALDIKMKRKRRSRLQMKNLIHQAA